MKPQESLDISGLSDLKKPCACCSFSSRGIRSQLSLEEAECVLYASILHTGDMYSHDGNVDEPEWVKTEREQFVEFRDKNRDGKMDKEETKDWILPSDYDHAEAEARHLVYESDQNKVCHRNQPNLEGGMEVFPMYCLKSSGPQST